jgi:hypothetical protein
MNERSIDLYKQALEFAYTTIGKYQHNTSYFQGTVAGKFAELIVRECATLCINEGRAHDQWFGSHCAITVKEHFGVDC